MEELKKLCIGDDGPEMIRGYSSRASPEIQHMIMALPVAYLSPLEYRMSRSSKNRINHSPSVRFGGGATGVVAAVTVTRSITSDMDLGQT
jgi:hypothetical protein